MTTPRVSVLIPLFNGLPYARQALDSVLQQTRPVDEIVICDGGSTDGSLTWLRSLEIPHLVKDELPVGTTAGQNWTRCTELATGDYIKLLCQDDYLHENAIAQQLADLVAHPECALAIGQRDIVSADGSQIARARGCKGLTQGVSTGIAALRACYLEGTNVLGEPVTTLFRREEMLQALPWVDDQPFVLDLMFATEILTSSNVFVRRESVGAFRVSSASWSTQLSQRQRKQFRYWQQQVESVIGPLTPRQRLKAVLSLERETLLRRAAYAYLRFFKRLS